MAFSLQVNYTDWATALVGEFSVDYLQINVVAWLAQRISTGVNLGFLDCFLF
jgi:hypothetical protein